MSFSIAFITTEEILGGGEKNLLLVVDDKNFIFVEKNSCFGTN